VQKDEKVKEGKARRRSEMAACIQRARLSVILAVILTLSTSTHRIHARRLSVSSLQTTPMLSFRQHR